MPWSFSAFLPAHQLTVRRVSVPYNPAWYGKRSAYPKFDELPLVFDGFPPNGGASCVTYWFVRRADNQPFMSTWYEGSWRTPNGQTSPADTVSEGWQMIASLRESLEMSYVMIDEANAGQASHGELNAIVDDTAGLSALRVALEAKRLRH
ncbi:hypothetical protein LMG32289_05437 [Cupriavidus pampae]|uniref:Uncharacterized protein n=2 Tax=Cupriavidus pampae TaxID=659251 RepID=A0ABN7ZIG7_9BURK|nr:hypothetical protein LMG32289_05437 [Cupriavidus pampae]